MAELEAIQTQPTVLHQDNLGAICWTTEVQGLRKVKHIGIRYHYVRDAVDERAVQVEYVASADNKADGLTKVLVTSNFESFKSAVGVVPRNVPATR